MYYASTTWLFRGTHKVCCFFFKTFDFLEAVLICARKTHPVQYGFLVIPYFFRPWFQCLSPTKQAWYSAPRTGWYRVLLSLYQSILQVFEDLTWIKQLQCSGIIDLLYMPGWVGKHFKGHFKENKICSMERMLKAWQFWLLWTWSSIAISRGMKLCEWELKGACANRCESKS